MNVLNQVSRDPSDVNSYLHRPPGIPKPTLAEIDADLGEWLRLARLAEKKETELAAQLEEEARHWETCLRLTQDATRAMIRKLLDLYQTPIPDGIRWYHDPSPLVVHREAGRLFLVTPGVTAGHTHDDPSTLEEMAERCVLTIVDIDAP